MAANNPMPTDIEHVAKAVELPETKEDRRKLVLKALLCDFDRENERLAFECLRKLPGENVLAILNPARGLELFLAPNGSQTVREIIMETYRQHYLAVAGPSPSALERLLAERIVVCGMQLTYFENDYADADDKRRNMDCSLHDQRRIDLVHRRYLAAIKSLARVRSMQIPVRQLSHEGNSA